MRIRSRLWANSETARLDESADAGGDDAAGFRLRQVARVRLVVERLAGTLELLLRPDALERARHVDLPVPRAGGIPLLSRRVLTRFGAHRVARADRHDGALLQRARRHPRQVVPPAADLVGDAV